MKALLFVAMIFGVSPVFAKSLSLDSERLSDCQGRIQLRGKSSNRYLEVQAKYCSRLVVKDYHGNVIKEYRMPDRNGGYGGNYTLTKRMKDYSEHGDLTVVVRSRSGAHKDVVTVKTSSRRGGGGGSHYGGSRSIPLPNGWEVSWAKGRINCYVYNEHDQAVTQISSSYCNRNHRTNHLPPGWEYTRSTAGYCYLWNQYDQNVQMMIQETCDRY